MLKYELINILFRKLDMTNDNKTRKLRIDGLYAKTNVIKKIEIKPIERNAF